MNEIAHFYKIPYKEFVDEFTQNVISKAPCTSKTKWSENELQNLYDNINLPTKIKDINVYGFKFPKELNLRENRQMLVPTGIKCEILDNDYIFIAKRFFTLGTSFNPYKASIFNCPEIITSIDDTPINILLSSFNQELHFDSNEIYAIGMFVKTGIAF